MKTYVHLMGRTLDRLPFNIPLSELWEIEQKRLLFLYQNFQWEIHAYVLMPNHFHLLAFTHDKLHLNQFPVDLEYKLEPITTWKAYCDTYRYLYLNPVRAGLAKAPHHYPYSTLHSMYFRKPFLCPLRPRVSNGLGGIEGEVYWVAHSPLYFAMQNKQKSALKSS